MGRLSCGSLKHSIHKLLLKFEGCWGYYLLLLAKYQNLRDVWTILQLNVGGRVEIFHKTRKNKCPLWSLLSESNNWKWSSTNLPIAENASESFLIPKQANSNPQSENLETCMTNIFCRVVSILSGRFAIRFSVLSKTSEMFTNPAIRTDKHFENFHSMVLLTGIGKRKM